MTDLTAPWIWFAAPRTEDVFARARRTFTLDRLPAAATIRITCSGHYRLWVNGAFAGRGPCRSNPWRQRYDELDIKPLLRPGRNVLAVQLIHYGYRTACCLAVPPGFWCQAQMDATRIESDAAWRMSLDPAFATGTGRRNQDYGCIEIFDARREEPWHSGDYDDSGWPTGQVLARPMNRHGPHTPPWDALIPRGIPQMREEPIRPQQVVRVAEVVDQEFAVGMVGGGSITNLAGYLLQDVPAEAELTRIENAESLVGQGVGPAVVYQPSVADQGQRRRRCATIILDFGREITAFGTLDVEGEAGAIVDIAYAERLVGGRVQAVVQNTAYADRYILRAGRQQHEVYDWKGYRYVQLTFRNLTGPLKVHAVGATFTGYPLAPAGAFQCSDPLLSKVWQVGAYTQQLCTHDSVMDCPWREQDQWLGDGRVQLLVLQNAFGERAMTRKFVEQFAEGQFSSGMIPSKSPDTRDAIVDYALWWVQSALDVLRFDGDVAFARRMMPTAERLMDWFAACRNQAGLLANVSGWVFIDWANVAMDGVCAPLNAIYAIALAAAADLATATGQADLADRWRGDYDRVRAAFHDTFFDPTRKFYADNLTADGKPAQRFSLHTQSIAVLAGLARVPATDLMARAIDDPTLVLTEPFFSFYLLEALATAGLAGRGLDFVRRRWGAMLDGGATSFWEEWQVDGTFRGGAWLARPRSHCHAWSAGPTAWISRHVLGVRGDAVGQDVLVVAPQPGDLTSAAGVVPTRFGPVSVNWRVADGRLKLKVAAPKGVRLDMQAPTGLKLEVE